MTNESELLVAIAATVFGSALGTLGWVARSIILRVDDLAKGMETIRDKHGKEIRNTRAAVSYLAGKLEFPEPRYDD